eukprot:tig00000204_g17772.t1
MLFASGMRAVALGRAVGAAVHVAPASRCAAASSARFSVSAARPVVHATATGATSSFGSAAAVAAESAGAQGAQEAAAISKRALLLASALLSAATLVSQSEADCAKDDSSKEGDAVIDMIVKQLGNAGGFLGENVHHVAPDVTFGFLSGIAAGYAGKQIGKLSMTALGLIFIGLQVSSHYGYVSVNWNEISKSMMKPLDVNGDGKVDNLDYSIIADRVLRVLKANLPGAGGFGAGVAIGLRLG